jgi:hypothetical protein
MACRMSRPCSNGCRDQRYGRKLIGGARGALRVRTRQHHHDPDGAAALIARDAATASRNSKGGLNFYARRTSQSPIWNVVPQI